MVLERLVAAQEVNDTNRFHVTVFSSLKSAGYAAISTSTPTSFVMGNTDNICGFAWNLEAQSNLLSLFKREATSSLILRQPLRTFSFSCSIQNLSKSA
jgi:hypothetical protein